MIKVIATYAYAAWIGICITEAGYDMGSWKSWLFIVVTVALVEWKTYYALR